MGAGGWSGFPSHKHDTDRLPDETHHDECYNFRFKPDYGSGMQMLQRVDNEPGDAYHIIDRSTVLIDKGYHPCCVLPGYEMYYFTILGGQPAQPEAIFPAHPRCTVAHDPRHHGYGGEVQMTLVTLSDVLQPAARVAMRFPGLFAWAGKTCAPMPWRPRPNARP